MVATRRLFNWKEEKKEIYKEKVISQLVIEIQIFLVPQSDCMYFYRSLILVILSLETSADVKPLSTRRNDEFI